MNIIPAVVAITLSAASLPALASEWRGEDKKKHFKYSVFIGAGAVTALNFGGYKGDAPLTATTICSTIGLGKEIYDIKATGFDEKDLAVDIVGCVLSSYLVDYGMRFQVDKDVKSMMINYEKKF